MSDRDYCKHNKMLTVGVCYECKCDELESQLQMKDSLIRELEFSVERHIDYINELHEKIWKLGTTRKG